MFLRSVGAVFRGVSAFPEFAKRNPFRALFHLLLFCVVLSFLCSVITIYRVNMQRVMLSLDKIHSDTMPLH